MLTRTLTVRLSLTRRSEKEKIPFAPGFSKVGPVLSRKRIDPLVLCRECKDRSQVLQKTAGRDISGGKKKKARKDNYLARAGLLSPV